MRLLTLTAKMCIREIFQNVSSTNLSSVKVLGREIKGFIVYHMLKFRKRDFVDRFLIDLFFRLPKLSSFLFFNFTIWTVVTRQSSLQHSYGFAIRKTLYPRNSLIFLICKSKFRDERKKIKFLSALWMLKITNTFFLIYLEENECVLVFQKFKLNSQNMDYIMRLSHSVIVSCYYYCLVLLKGTLMQIWKSPYMF